MAVLDKNFVKAIRRHIHDCANPIQLKALLVKYRSYVFTIDISEVFYERIDFFKYKFENDELFEPAIEELEEMLEQEITISNLSKNRILALNANDEFANHPKIVRSIMADLPEGSVQYHEKENLIKCMKINNGNKLYMCRMLNMDCNKLNILIKKYNLKDILNEIRREFRARLSNNLKE